MVTTTFEGAPTTDILAPADQAVFAVQRATGAGSATQYVWAYSHRVDLEGLRRFHRNLRAGRLSHRIRRSALPFGPPRWVSGHDVPSHLRIATPRPAAAARQWLDEQAQARLDPERGLAWQLGVLPLADGGAVVSLVVSRCVADGAGLNLAVTEAIAGWNDDCSWPAAAHRSVRMVFSDMIETARSLPAVSRAALAASSAARQHFDPADDGEAPLELPTATVVVDGREWDRQAETLEISPATLVAVLSAEVARRLGRSEDGTVDLRLAVNERVSSADTRANAQDIVDIPLTTDADPATIRADIKSALHRHRQVHDVRAEFAPLPPWMIRRAPFVAFGGLHTVVADNLGEGHPIIARPDGSEADNVYVRSLCPGLTKATVHRIGGVLTVTFGRTAGRAFVSVVGYQPGRDNDHDSLHRILNDALTALGLSASAIKEVPTC